MKKKTLDFCLFALFITVITFAFGSLTRDQKAQEIRITDEEVQNGSSLCDFSSNSEEISSKTKEETTNLSNMKIKKIESKVEEISEKIKEESSPEKTENKKKYTDEDLDLLARIIYQEAGCSWLSDEHQLLVGAVVINRVRSSDFPSSIREVIYQPGQYSPVTYGTLYNSTPDERTYKNAKKILEGEFECPSNVVWQACFIQGDGIYKAIYDETLGTTTYFCYSN